MDRGNTSSHKNVIFVGTALGMLAAAASQTIVSPAMPVIVAELGGIEHYSWIATSALLASAVIVPIVGKLSDIYGRRGFYIAGLVIFMLGSILAGAAQGFWWLIAARAVQGLGMGTIMPLAQAIIGDIISPRERGKYMGYLGGVFGIASIAGPLVGGWITDNFSWRWLFYINLPIGIAALAFIVAYLHLPHTPRRRTLDYIGFVTLAIGLSSVLLATSWGGTQYPWDSWQIIALYVVGALSLSLFAINENYAKEPVIPLRLFGNSIFTLSNVANFAVAMCMFGAIFFIPIYAQGVIGVSVTNSGLVLIPLTVSMILVSVLVGRLITYTGRYKGFVLAGILVMGLGYYMLTQLEYGSTQTDLTLAMIVVGLGLGAVLQTYTLIVQNATSRSDLGVATATTQLSRSIGATLGTAIFGTIMTSGLRTEVPKYLPAEALNGPQAEQFSGGSGVGSLLDPSALTQLPEMVAIGIREGLAAAMHPVFVAGIPILIVAFVATLFIKALPLRSIAFVDAEKEMLRNANQGTPEGVYEGASTTDGSRNSLAFTGSALQDLARKTANINGETLNLNEGFLTDLNPDELDTYLDKIDAMSFEELEEQLPKAQEALDALESKLEELMSLRDATLIGVATMAARLSALKKAGSLYDPIINSQPAPPSYAQQEGNRY